MILDWTTLLLLMSAATPILLAALGEAVVERAGVLNLGVEGMMLVGAAMGYWATQRVGGPDAFVLIVAIVVAAFSGLAMAAIHAFLTITLRASQIVSGLALTIFAGVTMVTSVKFYSFKDINLRKSVPFVVVAAFALVLALISSYPPGWLFGFFLVYALSGYVMTVLPQRKTGKQAVPLRTQRLQTPSQE